MDQAIPTLKRDVLRDLVLGVFFGKDGSPIYAGGFEISAGVARYEQWKRFVYDEPRTYECRQYDPTGLCPTCWTVIPCTTQEQKEFKVSFFPRFQPYIRYRPSVSESTTTDTRLGTFVLDFAESNRADVQRNIKSDGWHVVWGVNLNEIEYLKFANAAAQGVFTGGATLVVYFQEYLTKTLTLLETQLNDTRLYHEILSALGVLIQNLVSGGHPEQTIGSLQIQIGEATYNRWLYFRYPVGLKSCTWGLGPIKTDGICLPLTFATKKIALPNHHQPYIRFRWTDGKTFAAVGDSQGAENRVGYNLVGEGVALLL